MGIVAAAPAISTVASAPVTYAAPATSVVAAAPAISTVASAPVTYGAASTTYAGAVAPTTSVVAAAPAISTYTMAPAISTVGCLGSLPFVGRFFRKEPEPVVEHHHLIERPHFACCGAVQEPTRVKGVCSTQSR